MVDEFPVLLGQRNLDLGAVSTMSVGLGCVYYPSPFQPVRFRQILPLQNVCRTSILLMKSGSCSLVWFPRLSDLAALFTLFPS